MYINTTLGQINTAGTITTTGTGNVNINSSYSSNAIYDSEISYLKDRVTRLERQLDMSNIAILAAMQKFTKEECDNIRKMLESNDPASVELAKTIIEESLCQ
jgi:hypothetical protein